MKNISIRKFTIKLKMKLTIFLFREMDAPRCKIVNQQKDDVGRNLALLTKLMGAYNMLPFVLNERATFKQLDRDFALHSK